MAGKQWTVAIRGFRSTLVPLRCVAEACCRTCEQGEDNRRERAGIAGDCRYGARLFPVSDGLEQMRALLDR